MTLQKSWGELGNDAIGVASEFITPLMNQAKKDPITMLTFTEEESKQAGVSDAEASLAQLDIAGMALGGSSLVKKSAMKINKMGRKSDHGDGSGPKGFLHGDGDGSDGAAAVIKDGKFKTNAALLPPSLNELGELIAKAVGKMTEGAAGSIPWRIRYVQLPDGGNVPVIMKMDKQGSSGKRKEDFKGKTEQDYRKLIDEAEARGDSKAANDLRYERYCARKEASGDVPRSREDWDIANERLKNNSSRGSEEEKQGRESLTNHLGRELEDNNKDTIVTFTSSEGHVTRPDSIGRNENKEIDIVHDHKHHTGEGNQVIYNDSQMRAEKEMAEMVENGRHIVTMSSDNPDLYGVPPKPRPSAPLASGSEIYYTDPSSGKVTHKWIIDKETGEGFWEDV